MATAVARPSSPPRQSPGLPDRRFDHFFFSSMALLMLGTVFVGFAPTYYLAGVFRAPLPSLIMFLLACLMVVLGVLAATDSLVREAGPVGRDPKFFYIIPLSNMVVFGTLVFFAFRARFNPTAHKRLILLATLALMIAAIARWPLALVHRNPFRAALVSYIFIAILVAYDLWSTRKIHRATISAGAFLIVIEQIAPPIGHTAAWHTFASWVQTVAR